MILEVPNVMFVRVVCVPIINFCTCALKLIYRYVLVCITLDKLFYVVCDVWAHLPRVTREPFHMLIHVIPGDARDDLRATDITRFYLSPPLRVRLYTLPSDTQNMGCPCRQLTL